MQRFPVSTTNRHFFLNYPSCRHCRASFYGCFPSTANLQLRYYFQRTHWLPSSSSSSPSWHEKHNLPSETSGNANRSNLLSAEAFSRLTPMVLLQKALHQYTLLDDTQLSKSSSNHLLISRDKFNHFCSISNVQEPESALQALDEAGVVVSLDQGRLVHLRPVQYVQEVEIVQSLLSKNETEGSHNTTNSLNENVGLVSHRLPDCFLLTESQRRIDKLVDVEVALRVKLYPAIAKAARWRRLIWSAALFYAGFQLAAVAHLTYVEFDWDVMEPVSYCLSIGTDLLFLAYYVWYDKQYSYSGFDKQRLPKKVRQYAPKDFNWERYEKVCAQLVEERKLLEKLQKWAKTH
ncbi:unnamed protein product [Phytomonas sp. Hart1]|nr:unnamed protein product [Phytomonas sp. Hart1]|eukprot:CCW71107.1 unnamed protein product [Phytomonas sp. isolate Hart1]